MLKRLFGTKKDSGEASDSAEVAREEQRLEAETKAADAMKSIRENMDMLNQKIKHTQDQIDRDFEEAKKLKMKNKDDPNIKILLTKVKKGRERIVQYNNVLLQQQSTLATVDDMTFLNEMVAVMEVTKKALDAAYADSGEKLQDLMDDIADKKLEVENMMGILTETQSDVEVDDLMDELDNEIAREKEKGLVGLPGEREANNDPLKFPSAPTALPSLPKLPVQQSEEAELEEMLKGLYIVC